MNESEKNLRRLVTGFTLGILARRKSAGFCWAVCAPLEGLLRYLGHDCELSNGYVGEAHHYWITLRDGRIIDPTANQFKTPDGKMMPKVFIGKRPKWYRVKK